MISAVLNPESDGVSFAVLQNGDLIIDKKVEMYGRDAAELPGFVTTELASAGLTLADVDRWNAGSGPGSFTALRMIAALISGWCFGRKGVCRAIPGAIAAGAALKLPENSRIGILYDGRNKEILYYGLTVKDGHCIPTGETSVLDKTAAETFFESRKNKIFAVSYAEKDAVSAIVPDNTDIRIIQTNDTAALAKNPHIAFDDDLTRMVYIRPAVHTGN